MKGVEFIDKLMEFYLVSKKGRYSMELLISTAQGTGL
jgi:hypothetical protein